MKPLIMNSDILVHETTFGPILFDLNKEWKQEELGDWRKRQEVALADPMNKIRWCRVKDSAEYTGHSNIEQAGVFARSVNAKNLFLVHFSRRYDAEDEETRNKIEFLFEEGIREYFDGFVKCAHEGYKFVL